MALKVQRGDRRAPSSKVHFGAGSAMSMRPTGMYIAWPPQNPGHGTLVPLLLWQPYL